jgi:hypothetical protein
LVLVLESALDDVLTWGVKVDGVLCCNAADQALQERVLHQQPISVVSMNPTDDPLKIAIDFLRSKNSHAVNVIADTTIDSFVASHRDWQFQCTLINQLARWSLIHKKHYQKWLEVGSELLIFAQEIHDVRFTGCHLDPSQRKLFCHAEGVIHVESNADFWIGEPW